MEPLLLAVIAGGSAAAAWLHVHRRRDDARVWEEVAARCGLTDVVASRALFGRQGVYGWSDKLRVSLERYASADGSGAGIRVRVSDLDRHLNGVTLRAEAAHHVPILGTPERVDITVGDAAFDAAFQVGGATAVVLARLDAATRRKLLVLNTSSRVVLVDGELRVELPASTRTRPERTLPVLVKAAMSAASLLARPLDVVGALAANAREDPVPAVRLQNLLALAREFRAEPVAQETLRDACADPDPEVRLRAALVLGPEGRKTLLALTESDVDDTYVARAVLALRDELTRPQIFDVLRRALRGRCFDTAEMCIRLLARHTGPDVVPTLTRVLAVEGGNDIGVAAARALGSAEGPVVEAALIDALGRDNADLRVAAADALARMGSVAAVLPLRDAEERWRDPHLSRAARQAVATIQSRSSSASPGQLSVVDAQAGQLTVVDPTGQLSLVRAEGGEVSLPDAAAARLSLHPKRAKD